MLTTTLLSMGSNIEPRATFIALAIEALRDFAEDIVVSEFYQTQPVGFLDQPHFVNIALKCSTKLSAEELHQRCKETEVRIGRIHREMWHKREIDIDVLLFGDEIINTRVLQIPHPRMADRRFVLVPSVEIAAEMIHPVLQRSLADLLRTCPDSSDVSVLQQNVTSNRVES